MSFVLTSSAFATFQPMPVTYTCEGEDVSPGLIWSGAPENTAAFALIMDDHTGPTGQVTHWVLFNLPADVRHLDEAVPATERLPNGALHGHNDFGTLGYRGPCPRPHVTHHYHFALYALDRPLDLGPGASATQVRTAMEGHILDRAELIGVYRGRLGEHSPKRAR